MALKGDREIIRDDISYTCPTATNRGVVLCVTTQGSGVALGDSAGVADLLSNPSGYKVAGPLLNDMVSVDLTRYHVNFQKDEMPVNYPCRLLKLGWVVTDQLKSGDSPSDGATAYLTANGQVTVTMSASGGLVATPKVGVFRGLKDESGFVKLEVNLPIVN